LQCHQKAFDRMDVSVLGHFTKEKRQGHVRWT
jgi:hypothetical protein